MSGLYSDGPMSALAQPEKTIARAATDLRRLGRGNFVSATNGRSAVFTEIWMWILAVVLVAVGVVGTIFPALPGVVLVFCGLLVAAWVDEFQRVTWIPLVVLGLLTFLSFVVDFLATVLGVQRVGATRLAIVGALVGTVVGIFFGILGLIFGPFIGAVVGEMLSHGKVNQASRVGIATWVGLIFGTLAKIGLVFTMLGVFALAYFL